MPVVEVALPHHRYEVVIEPGVLSRLGGILAEVAGHPKAAVFADAAVAETHAARAHHSVVDSGRDAFIHAIPTGETHKTLKTVEGLYGKMIEAALERHSPVVAVGGGVAGDTVGFAAATYLRGVPFIQCPTTLLAMVDASVGGKVGVNLPQGKNLVGCFYQPVVVLIDPDTLGTLPDRELRCGLAECVKHAVIRDESLFDWIDGHAASILARDNDALIELITRNVQLKARVVMADEKEAGERAHLNFGHTFAHAIEATTGYGAGQGSHHGEAVSIGMVAAARLAEATGLCSPEVASRLTELLTKLGLPTTAAGLPGTADLLASMRLDKKVSEGSIRFVLPTRIGEVCIRDSISDQQAGAAWDTVRE